MDELGNDSTMLEHAIDACEAMFLGVDALGMELAAGDAAAAAELADLIARAADELDERLSAALRLDA